MSLLLLLGWAAAGASDDDRLLYDTEDGALVFDQDDGEYLYDANDPTGAGASAPILEGLLDAVGGPLGGPIGDRVYLVETFIAASGSSEISATWLGVANHPVAGEMIGEALVYERPPFEFRLANRHFVSLYDDPDAPSRYWDDRLLDPGSLSLSIPLVTVGAAQIESGFGLVVVANTDAAFDTILDDNQVVSQAITIRAGTLGRHLADFETVAVARLTSIGMTETEVTLHLEDPTRYAQNLYPTTVYTGLGDAGGPAELDGVVVPVVLGRVWNMRPVLVDSVNLIFQVHDGAVSAITGVFDGGVALAFSTDHTSYGALAAATIDPGGYATCLETGHLKVRSSPVFEITAHVDGHAAAGVTIRSIATYLAGQLEAVLGLDVDLDAFAALPEWTAGWIWSEPFTFAAALDRFVGDAGWYWGGTVAGSVSAGQLLPPDPGAVAWRYDAADILSIERSPLPEGYEGQHHRRIVQFKRNWTVHTSLAAAAVNAPFRQREWRTATATRSVGAINALDPPVLDTSLADEASATALADYLLDLHGTARRMFRVSVKLQGWLPKVGATVRVTWPRLGLATGGLFRVVDADLRLATSEATLLVWG